MKHWLKRHRYGALLGALLLCLVLSPVAETGLVGEVVILAPFALVMIAAVNVASGRRSHLVLALLLALPAFALDLAGAVTPAHELSGGLIMMVLLFFVMGLMLRDLLSARETDFDMICGAIAVYFLIGVAWALSYGVIETFWPGTYDGDLADGASWPRLLYFSLTTLTTLGYGDLTPANAAAGIWATLEAAAGSLYVAVLVARAVALIRG